MKRRTERTEHCLLTATDEAVDAIVAVGVVERRRFQLDHYLGAYTARHHK